MTFPEDLIERILAERNIAEMTRARQRIIKSLPIYESAITNLEKQINNHQPGARRNVDERVTLARAMTRYQALTPEIDGVRLGDEIVWRQKREGEGELTGRVVSLADLREELEKLRNKVLDFGLENEFL